MGVLVGLGFAVGVTGPGLLRHPETIAVAQEQPPQDSEFNRYVRAAFEIETKRRQMMGQVKQITGGNVPNNVCASLDQVAANIRGQVQEICQSFATFASSAVKRNGLSSAQFNQYQRQMNDPEMVKQVNSAIQQMGLK
jgi:hypothetical protein